MEFEVDAAIEAYGEEHRRQIVMSEKNKMFVKMFMKKIGMGETQCSNFNNYVFHNHYYVRFDIHAEIHFSLNICILVNPHISSVFDGVYLHSKDNITYNQRLGHTNIYGNRSILDDKPKSKYIFDYFASDKRETIKPIIRDLYPFIFTTDYMQNLPKAYTFLLCCPGNIPKGVDKIIAKKILFFPN